MAHKVRGSHTSGWKRKGQLRSRRCWPWSAKEWLIWRRLARKPKMPAGVQMSCKLSSNLETAWKIWQQMVSWKASRTTCWKQHQLWRLSRNCSLPRIGLKEGLGHGHFCLDLRQHGCPAKKISSLHAQPPGSFFWVRQRKKRDGEKMTPSSRLNYKVRRLSRWKSKVIPATCHLSTCCV